MVRSPHPLQVEPKTLQIANRPQRHSIQAIEPEAERLLNASGGKVLRDQEGYLYEEYVDYPWPNLVIYWPVQTRFVLLSARGQEESCVIFVAALLPDGQAELHLTYDYRPWGARGPFEEFFYAAGGTGSYPRRKGGGMNHARRMSHGTPDRSFA